MQWVWKTEDGRTIETTERGVARNERRKRGERGRGEGGGERR